MTGATHHACARAVRDVKGELPEIACLELFSSGRSFQIGDITVTPFTIPHDAADPVGFTFRAEGVKLGFATDLGYVPASVRDHLRGCDGLVMESNHDVEMLRGGPYPWSVKQRVMSRVGHLSNEALAEFFASDYDGGQLTWCWRTSPSRTTILNLPGERQKRLLGPVGLCFTIRCYWRRRPKPCSQSGSKVIC